LTQELRMEGSPALASVLWQIGGFLCHQLPDRSPQFGGTVFPLCYRCAGLYLGLLTTFAYLALGGGWRRRLPELRCALWISLLIVPLMVDGWANLMHLWSSAGWVRALTGVGVGLVLPLLLVPLAQRPGLGTSDGLKPTVSTPLALLTPMAISVALLWLVDHPMRLWLFQTLAVVAASAPAVFLVTFVLAGWRNRAAFVRTRRVAPHDVPW
jgi:uncharacterized membrane protein